MTKKEETILIETRKFVENEFYLENIEIDQADESFTFSVLKKSKEAYIIMYAYYTTSQEQTSEPVRFSGLTDTTTTENVTESIRTLKIETLRVLEIEGNFFESKYTTIPFKKCLYEYIAKTLNEFHK